MAIPACVYSMDGMELGCGTMAGICKKPTAAPRLFENIATLVAVARSLTPNHRHEH